jgi:hypothetical protein
MATRKKTAETGTDVVDWEAQMRRDAEVAAGAQRSSGGGGKFFSTQAGVLQFDGTPLPGNQMAVIVLADIMENSWYEDKYDPDTPASPKCFAFGHDEEDMEPHEKVDQDPYFARQNPECHDCPRNEWGSADTGRGKACKNVMRLALIPAGVYKAKGTGRNAQHELELFDDVTHFAKAEVAFLKLPVMSVKNYAKYVKSLAADMGRPPHGVITNIYLEPDPKSQYKVCFEVIDKAPKDLLQTLLQRHAAENASINFPYSPPLDDDDRAERAPAKSNNKLRGKAPAKGGRR